LGHFDESQNLHRLPLVLLLNPVATGLLGALGEEIGWRGFLQPQLQKKFGTTTALLMLGIIWAYWHLPANLGGHNGVEHRILNTFVIFPIAVIGMTFAFGWLRIKSESIWPCVYFHGVINSISNYWLIKPDTELTEKIVGMVAWLLIGFYFFQRLRKPPLASRF